MQLPSLAQLQGQIDAERQAFTALKARLEGLLGPYAFEPAALVGNLLSMADEFGAPYAVDMVRHSPESLGLAPLAPAPLAALDALLTETHEAGRELDLSVALREDLRDAEQPGRLRVMVNQGREFTFNLATGEWIYLDQPDVVYKYPVDVVDTRTSPDPEDLPTVTRRQRRGMSP